MQNLYELLIKEIIKTESKTPEELSLIKRNFSEKYKIPYLKNTDLLKVYHELVTAKKIKESKRIEKLLRIRGIRSLSGVAVVSVLTKPYPCPSKCLYCPTQKGMPKSYLDNEPAVMRAVLNDFDPQKQIKTRLKSLNFTGHPTDKIELIVIGGTWSFLPKDYQEWFIKNCFDACNGVSSRNLQESQKKNETATHRIIGITIETRPDFINAEEIINLRNLGVTRIELGVQSIYDNVLKFNSRGHDIKSTIEAIKILKDAGLKICYHMMPNLPGSNFTKDLKMFKEIFTNQNFHPDFLKIYPCVVVKEAPLYKLWRQGKYKSYTDLQLIKLLKSIKEIVPVYCRIIRIIRDIPASRISGGSKISNLREVVIKELQKEGKRCMCIRCREIKDEYNPKAKLKLFRKDYAASDGKEIFLSFEDTERKNIYSLLRLRIPSFVFQTTTSKPSKEKLVFPVLENSAIIREVHTYGQSIPIEEKIKIAAQHKGLGKKLIKEAEKIAKKEFGLKKIAVISGVGVRNYYKKLGYKLIDTYMVKN